MVNPQPAATHRLAKLHWPAGPRAPIRIVLAIGILMVAASAVIVARAAERRARFASANLVSTLDALPFPGTPDAAPDSQITLPSLTMAQVRSVIVIGSSSGRHGGALTPLPGGSGVAFSPKHVFTSGERVTVRIRLTSSAAGAAIGVPGRNAVSYTFNVVRPGSSGPLATQATARPAKPAATQAFHSQPDLRPPVVKLTRAGDPSAGDIFLDAQAAPQAGAMIVDGHGRLVWFDPVPKGQTATDVRTQTYHGQRVLTYWQGQVVAGHGSGHDVILNTAYQTVATVNAGEGYHADLHEFRITPQNTALITVYAPARANLRSVGGPRDGTVLDSIVQNVDIATGKVLWEWHALGHVPLTRSYSKPAAGQPFDYFHINAIQELANGNILISARNTWAIYEINRHTGKVIWQLGGKHSSFKMGPRTQFEWQHDARLWPNGTVTVFDDGASPPIEKQSRAIRLRINTRTMRATLDRVYFHSPSVLAGSQGSVQPLAHGDTFVGWGAVPDFSEYSAAGRQIVNGALAAPAQSYRAYRSQWTGQPATPPAIAVTATGASALTVYASWNGATDVASWRVLAGPSASTLVAVAEAKRTGFEATIPVATSQPYIAVQAIGAQGNVLASSGVVAR
ncbi:MAG: arylsulfotransferase family protein [Solirubrobacteraceae bacterium]